MFAEQQISSVLHGILVERVMVPPGTPMPDARSLRTIDQQVAIASTIGRKSGVKRFRHRVCPAHGNGRRQEGINPAYPRRQRTIRSGIKMHDLTRGMNTGIGPSCTNYRDRLSGNPGKRLFQFILNRSATGLRLPSSEGVAVILHTQGDPHGRDRDQPRHHPYRT